MARHVDQSPWVWQAVDFTRVKVIRITVAFDNATRVLSGATVFRDPECLFTKVYIGVGADGAPDSTPRAIPVPAGSHAFTAAQMAAVGLHTIEDILAFQITAGP